MPPVWHDEADYNVCGQIPTIEELHLVDYDYPMNDHAKAMCCVGHTFKDLVDDDVPTNDHRLLGN